MGQLQSIVPRSRRSRNLQLESFPDLSNFPPEVAVSVLSHLNATDLCLAACVWKHLADNELLWQRYYVLHFLSFDICFSSWKARCGCFRHFNWNYITIQSLMCHVKLMLINISEVCLFKHQALQFLGIRAFWNYIFLFLPCGIYADNHNLVCPYMSWWTDQLWTI